MGSLARAFGVEGEFHAPALSAGWIPRPRLVRDLAARDVRLVLIRAPAGFGKTAVVTQWRAAGLASGPFAWVSLGRGDDDPASLWAHVVGALRRACPGLGGDLPPPAGITDIDGGLLPALVNALAGLARPVVLVLDDCDLVSERRCHEQIEFLLLNLPPPARMVLVTRAAPPLRLARLRAAGDMAEIGMHELRFTRAEVAALAEAVGGVRLGGRDLAELTQRTEGWPVGVYLAALSLRGCADPSAFVRGFTGDDSRITDFFVTRVLGRQPDGMLRFLTRTAILGRFTPSLCEAVTLAPDASAVIDAVERENLFLLPLDENRQWSRYHRLFAAVLRSQLAAREPAIVPVLHRRASAWHRVHGAAAEAIDHAIAGGDAAGAIDLVAAHWCEQAAAGRTGTVRGWLAALGEEVVRGHPLAAHCAAWAAALSGEPAAARRFLRAVETAEYPGRLPDGMPSLRFSAALLRAAFGFDGVRVMRESAALAVGLETDHGSPWYALALTSLGFAQYLSGEPGAAESLGRAVLAEPAAPLARLTALAAAALMAADEGRLGQAETLAATARQIADRDGVRESPQNSIARAAAATVRARQGRLEEARDALERALRSRRRWLGLSPWPTVEVLLRLASVLLDLGEGAAAAAALAEAGDVLAALPDGAEALRARLDLLRRRLAGTPARTALQPLTGRELTVLRLLRGKLPLGEIARELGMSANTIKTHTRAIYRKLGVSDRYAAVARGHELGLS